MKLKNFNDESFVHNGKLFIKCIDHEWIEDACKRAISKIKKRPDYKNILFVSLLEGSVPFEEELSSLANWKMNIMQISYHSYKGEESTGEFTITKKIVKSKVKDKNVVIIEDIVDTGNTMQRVIADLKEAGAKSVKIVCLLDKINKHPKLPIIFKGFDILDRFVIGYGMDYDGEFRNLPHIYASIKRDDELVVDSLVNY